MRLLHLPFVVHKCIAQQLGLDEAFSLANVSKRSKFYVNRWFIPQRFSISYNAIGRFKIERNYSDESQNEMLRLVLADRSQLSAAHNYQLWTILNYSSVGVRINRRDKYATAIATYWPDSKGIHIEMLEFLMGVFPKSALSLIFPSGNIELVRNTLEWAKTHVKGFDTVVIQDVEERQEDTHDELVKLIFDECRDAKKLQIECKVSQDFGYHFETQFNFEYIIMTHAQWVTKDDMLNYFLNCVEVGFQDKHFNDQDLSEIFKAWTKHPEATFLRFSGLEGNFYRSSLLTDVVGQFPGALAIKKARALVCEDYEVLVFKEGRAYVIQAKDGTEGLVMKIFNDVIFTKHFQIGENVDRMRTTLMEIGNDGSDEDEEDDDEDEDDNEETDSDSDDEDEEAGSDEEIEESDEDDN